MTLFMMGVIGRQCVKFRSFNKIEEITTEIVITYCSQSSMSMLSQPASRSRLSSPSLQLSIFCCLVFYFCCLLCLCDIPPWPAKTTRGQSSLKVWQKRTESEHGMGSENEGKGLHTCYFRTIFVSSTQEMFTYNCLMNVGPAMDDSLSASQNISAYCFAETKLRNISAS